MQPCFLALCLCGLLRVLGTSIGADSDVNDCAGSHPACTAMLCSTRNVFAPQARSSGIIYCNVCKKYAFWRLLHNHLVSGL